MILECFYCFIISVCFSVIFNVRGRDVFYGGLGSGIGWAFYLACYRRFGSVVGSYFMATIVTTLYSEVLAIYRRKPATIFLIPSIIPFVPGGLVFRAMGAWLSGDQDTLLLQGRYAITVACSIAMGIIMGVTITRIHRNYMRLIRNKVKKGKTNENSSH